MRLKENPSFLSSLIYNYNNVSLSQKMNETKKLPQLLFIIKVVILRQTRIVSIEIHSKQLCQQLIITTNKDRFRMKVINFDYEVRIFISF